jgi:hypothetical protein
MPRTHQEAAGRKGAIVARTRRSWRVNENDLESGVAKLRKWHETGKKLLRKYPSVTRAASNELDEFAKENDMHASTARRLKSFAHEKKGYTEAELDRLVERCLKYERALGLSLIARLLSIPDRKIRAELELLTLENAWGRGRLDQEIVSRLRRRRAGSGRRPTVPTDGPSIWAQLDQYIETWVRWEATAKKQGILNGKKRILSEEIKKSLDGVFKEIGSLRESLDKERNSAKVSRRTKLAPSVPRSRS